MTLPDTWVGYQSMPPFFVIVILYYASPLRNWSNKGYFDKVSENIRIKLVEASGIDDDPVLYKWSKVRKVFFTLVDDHPSLKVQASIAYSNGLIWTSVADLRIISGLYCLFCVIYWFLFSSEGGLFAAGLFAAISAATYPISRIVTAKHLAIGNEQIDIIKMDRIESLKRKMEHISGE